MQTKKLLPSILFALLLGAAGCKSNYDITLRNQSVITSVGRPVYDPAHEVYRFKDARGETHVVPTVSISKIEVR